MWEIGVLGVLVLLLGVTDLLPRRNEREPSEGEDLRPNRIDPTDQPMRGRPA